MFQRIYTIFRESLTFTLLKLQNYNSVKLDYILSFNNDHVTILIY